MNRIKINKVSVPIPESWEELTVRQMSDALQYASEQPERWKDVLFRLCVYTGFAIPYEELSNSIISDEVLNFIVHSLRFEKEPLNVGKYVQDVPNFLEFEHPVSSGNTVKIRIPKKLDEERIGSKMMFVQEVIPKVNELGTIVPVLPLAIAIYLQPYVEERDFDTTRVQQFAVTHCENLPFVKALSVGTFFLKMSVDWKNGKGKSRNQSQAMTWMNGKRESKTSNNSDR